MKAMNIMKVKLLLPAVLLLLMSACTDQFLDVKPDQSLLVPQTVKDFDALMDNLSVMNQVPVYNVLATDDLYVTDAGLDGAAINFRQSYLWDPDVFSGLTMNDWNLPYQQVFYANIVLEGLEKTNGKSIPASEYDRIKGSALFYRSFAFYNLCQSFAPAYDEKTAESAPGVPLRLWSDINKRVGRGNLKSVFTQVLTDLEAAQKLLPEKVNSKSRPCKAAALALLARVTHNMEQYEAAVEYTQSALAQQSTLVDYNTLDSNAAAPLPSALLAANEVIYYTPLVNLSSLYSNQAVIADSLLYKSYRAYDLRKPVYFINRGKGVINFKGSYNGPLGGLFGGLATDELYLILAESKARTGKVEEAMAALNTLLAKRWKKDRFIPLQAADAESALRLILQERRKELLFRGIRWSDLRRLNKDPKWSVNLKRVYKGQEYTLLPGDPRYVLPIPDNEIAAGELEQNIRK